LKLLVTLLSDGSYLMQAVVADERSPHRLVCLVFLDANGRALWQEFLLPAARRGQRRMVGQRPRSGGRAVRPRRAEQGPVVE